MTTETYITTGKIWKAGTGTLVVSIPKNIIDLGHFKAGDYVEISIMKLKKKN